MLLWTRNKKRRSLIDGVSLEGDSGSQNYEKGFLDETDLENPYFKACPKLLKSKR